MDVSADRAFVRYVLPALILAGAIAFVAIPAWHILVPGPFSWHVRQPRVWQGAIEGVALMALMAAGLASRSRAARFLLVALPALVYLRRHAVDGALLVDVLYAEILCALGALTRRLAGAAPAADALGHAHDFAVGVAAWSAVAWALSAFHFGSAVDLRWITLALAIAAFLARPTPISLHLARRLDAAPRPTRALLGALIGAALVLAARSAIVTGYDSLWYGLRPEYVLVADGSVFDRLGLVAPVYYFPKLYELLLTPLAGLGSSSVMIGFGVPMLALVAIVARSIARDLGLADPVAWSAAALVASLPAIANSALSTKPDLIALFFVLLALSGAMRFIADRRPDRIATVLAFALLATQSKLTAIPFVAMLMLALIAAHFFDRTRRPSIAPIDEGALRHSVVALTLAAAVTILVTARTWIVAGMPTIGPDPLVSIWHALGLDFRAPAGTLHWTRAQDWSDVPLLVVDELFRPERLPHIVVSWLGNVWLLLALVALAAAPFARARPDRGRRLWPGIALMATGFVLILGLRTMVRGGDGNYYIVAAAVAIVYAMAAAWPRIADRHGARYALVAAIALSIAFQSGYAFISAGWAAGTRGFDLDFDRGLRPLHKERWRLLDKAGLATIADEVRRGERVRRAVGCIGGTLGDHLPFRYEDLEAITYSRPEYLADAASFEAFLRDQRIDALIVPRPMTDEVARSGRCRIALFLPALEAVPGVRIVDDRKFRLLDYSHAPSIARGGEAD